MGSIATAIFLRSGRPVRRGSDRARRRRLAAVMATHRRRFGYVVPDECRRASRRKEPRGLQRPLVCRPNLSEVTSRPIPS